MKGFPFSSALFSRIMFLENEYFVQDYNYISFANRKKKENFCLSFIYGTSNKQPSNNKLVNH